MLPEDSILVQIPQWLSEETRQFFEAIANAYDMAALSYRRISHTALSLSETDTLNASRTERVELFEAVWAFVLHAHMLRGLLDRLPGRKPEPLSEFVESNENLQLLRNQLQHFDTNIRNQVGKKGRKDPIFGLLTWAHIRQMNDPVRVRSFVFSSGRFRSHETLMQIATPFLDHCEYPVGMFTLQAFGKRLNISRVFRQMNSVAEAFENDIRPSMMDKIQEYAAETGGDPSDLIKPCEDRFFAFLDFSAENAEGVISGYVSK